jgi:hypothetical protein
LLGDKALKVSGGDEQRYQKYEAILAPKNASIFSRIFIDSFRNFRNIFIETLKFHFNHPINKAFCILRNRYANLCSFRSLRCKRSLIISVTAGKSGANETNRMVYRPRERPCDRATVKTSHRGDETSEELRARSGHVNEFIFGAWRSLVAHLPWEQGVGRSNRLAPIAPVAQVDRAAAF